MSYNGSGTFQINTSGQPVVTGTSISSTVFNALTADLATGLSTAITKDGQTTTTARIPFALGINSTLVTDATNTTSGSIITAGGVGIAKALYVGTTANVAGAVTLGGVATFSAQPIFSSLTASSAVATDASKGLVSVTNTGTGNNVLATGPTISGPTISDGTANGVAYLNGSKVLTTGSALVFDGANFGVGVTPSAWTNYTGVLQMTGGSLAGYTGGDYLELSQNGYYASGSYKYVKTGYASKYQQNTGTHQWYVAASGSANATISYTQAMTLDASGNLCVGSTSSLSSAANRIDLTVNGTTTSMMTLGVAGTATSIFYASSGLTILGTKTASPLSFYTSDTERARIDSSGNLLVGTTGALGGNSLGRVNLQGSTSTTAPTVATAAGSASYTGCVFQVGCLTTSSTAWNLIQGYSGNGTTDNFSTLKFQVRGDGNVTNANNSYGAISDIKLKENITDATPKLEKLNQVRVVNYNIIGDQQKQLGVVAQELEQIFPSMVDETTDRDKEGNDLGTTTKSVKYSVFVPMLIKAIQEQQALITTLTDRITALEARNG